MMHKLKCWPAFFPAIVEGRKTFEFRVNDRGFQTGDMLFLREYSTEDAAYTGKAILARVTYILPVNVEGRETPFVIMAIKKEGSADEVADDF